MKKYHFVPLAIKLKISKLRRSIRLRRHISVLKKHIGDESIIYVLNTPSHGNLGDQLIAYAIDKFLNDHFPNKRVERIPTAYMECGVRLLRPAVRQKDTIIITGGGFLGDVYPAEEKRFHDVMKYFPNNKIILFPQTFFYHENSKLLNKAITLHKGCRNLIITTREKTGYDFISSHFDNAEVSLLPDIATYLNFSNIGERTNEIVICSRSDKEKSELSKQLINEAVAWAEMNKIAISHYDTQRPYAIKQNMRDGEIKNIVDKFASARLIVTDRLHGMLFSIITGTPVIAFDNTTKKISGAFNEWFSDVKYVQLCSDVNCLKEKMDNLYQLGGQKFNNEPYIKQLNKLVEYVNS